MNKGHVWAHELMHIDWAVNANEYGPNKRVGDLRMSARSPDGTPNVFKAYGAAPVKALARYSQDGGEWVIRNADSLALYASVRYIQSKLGNVYPHLPVAPRAPGSVWDPNNRDSDSINTLSGSNASLAAMTLYSNGTVGNPVIENFYSYSHDPKCKVSGFSSNDTNAGDDDGEVYDEDTDGNPDYTLQFDQFASQDDLSDDYVSQLNQWYSSLYGSSPATSTSSSTPTSTPVTTGSSSTFATSTSTTASSSPTST
ncbi:hypothetical protein GGR56DRAFT_32988 [Xylariaceae sp. FL0804]|nr:hypothetical protein GGR56DRAFT_32988 [Xylariaceae sp. FL0804]